jgi:hypothetical protein
MSVNLPRSVFHDWHSALPLPSGQPCGKANTLQSLLAKVDFRHGLQ